MAQGTKANIDINNGGTMGYRHQCRMCHDEFNTDHRLNTLDDVVCNPCRLKWASEDDSDTPLHYHTCHECDHRTEVPADSMASLMVTCQHCRYSGVLNDQGHDDLNDEPYDDHPSALRQVHHHCPECGYMTEVPKDASITMPVACSGCGLSRLLRKGPTTTNELAAMTARYNDSLAIIIQRNEQIKELETLLKRYIK